MERSMCGQLRQVKRSQYWMEVMLGLHIIYSSTLN